MTVAMIAHTAGASVANACQLPPRRCATLRKDNPIRMKIRDSSTNTTTCQTALAWLRVAADRMLCCRDAHHHAAGDGTQHARHVQPVAHDVGDPGNEEARDDTQSRIAHAHQQHRHQPSKRQPQCDATEREPAETQDCAPRAERARERGGDREPVENQAGGVVDQAFPLEEQGDTRRQRDSLQNRFGRDRIGRRHDGAQGETRRPGQVGLDPMRDETDRGGRESDCSNSEPQDDPQVGAEVAPHREISPRQQERRQKQHQHQVGIDLDLRCARNERERDPAENERGRRWHPQPARQQLQHDDHRHQDQHELETGDRGHLGEV